MNAKPLSEQIREAIGSSGATAVSLAAHSGVDSSQISRFLRGQRSVTVDTAEKLLAALGCTVTITGQSANAPLKTIKRKRRRTRKDD